MIAIKNYFLGVVKEARRIRWIKGDGFKKAFLIVIAYTIFFGLFLMLTDLVVIRLLKSINFK